MIQIDTNSVYNVYDAFEMLELRYLHWTREKCLLYRDARVCELSGGNIDFRVQIQINQPYST